MSTIAIYSVRFSVFVLKCVTKILTISLNFKAMFSKTISSLRAARKQQSAVMGYSSPDGLRAGIKSCGDLAQSLLITTWLSKCRKPLGCISPLSLFPAPEDCLRRWNNLVTPDWVVFILCWNGGWLESFAWRTHLWFCFYRYQFGKSNKYA